MSKRVMSRVDWRDYEKSTDGNEQGIRHLEMKNFLFQNLLPAGVAPARCLYCSQCVKFYEEYPSCEA